MAAQTFRELWSLVLLHVPAAPASLVQSWVQSSYDDLIARRHWAWTRADAVLTTLASRAITVTFTQLSTAITSAGLFVASDAGRQIRVGTSSPIYTIDTVTNANAAVLTQMYAGSSGAATATIHDRYLAMPADFRSIHTVTDPTNQRPVVWWLSAERLDLLDPGRINSDGRFRALVAGAIATSTALSGRILYEAWPGPTAAGSYLLKYFRRTDTLQDDDAFKGVLATYTGALVSGALAEAAKWPGTLTQKNPYFNLQLAKTLKEDFDFSAKQLDLMDDDQYLMDLQEVDLSRFGLSALSGDTTQLRQSDATLADYY